MSRGLGRNVVADGTAPNVLPLPTALGIDAWGNLTNRAGVTGMAQNCTTEGLSATATTQNQLSGIGMLYDAAGNVTKDNLGNTPTYDAENRIATVAGYTYSYDADGARMEKATGSSGTMYWPGPSGTLSETGLTGAINEEYIYFSGQRIARVDRPSGTVHYYFSNHLGSHTMVTSATGSCEQDADYFPYGGEITDHCPNVAQHYKGVWAANRAESLCSEYQPNGLRLACEAMQSNRKCGGAEFHGLKSKVELYPLGEPELHWFYAAMVLLCCQSKDRARARHYYTLYRRLAGEHPALQHAMGCLFCQQGFDQRAMVFFHAASQEPSLRGKAGLQLASLYLKQGDYALAAEHLRDARLRLPSSPEPVRLVGHLYRRIGQMNAYREAEREYLDLTRIFLQCTVAGAVSGAVI